MKHNYWIWVTILKVLVFTSGKEVYEQIAETYPEVYLLSNHPCRGRSNGRGLAYLEEISPESNWYVASLVKVSISWRLCRCCAWKLVEAASLSDDPIIQLGLAEIDLELERYQEAIQEYAQLDNRRDFGSDRDLHLSTDWFLPVPILVFEAAVPFLRESSGDWVWWPDCYLELATLLSDQEEFQSPDLLQTNWHLSPEFEGYEHGYAFSFTGWKWPWKALEIAKQGIEKNPFDAQLKLASALWAPPAWTGRNLSVGG